MTAEALSLRAQLARDTVGRWVRGPTVPTLAALRAVEGVLSSQLGYEVDLSPAVRERRSARLRDRSPSRSDPARSDGVWRETWGQLIPVAECRALWAGVHASIRRPEGSVPGDGQQDDVPEYVSRDHDERLRQRLVDASARGGLVILVGGLSVGKTRSLFEVTRTVLSDWRIFLPKDAAAVREASPALPARTVIWLDDSPVEKFLTKPGRGGLTRNDLIAIVRNRNQQPLIVVDTFWPSRYQALTAFLRADAADPHDDRYRDAREVLALAGEPINIPEQFSDAERVRVKAAAATDRRLAVAFNDTQFGVTQVLAGAPELISRWQHTDAYTQAVVTAAIDAQRLGIHPPLATDLLKNAATAYLTERHRASAQPDWFPRALARATDPGKGTTALLLPCPSPDPAVTGTITGYQVADYLLQHGTRTRFFTPAPAGAWNAYVDLAADPADLDNLAYNARQRRLYAYAEHFYLRNLQNKHKGTMDSLIEMLGEQTRVEELRYFASLGHIWAGDEVAKLLYAAGREDELRSFAVATGHPNAVSYLCHLVARRGRIDEAIAEAEALTVHDGAEEYISDALLPSLLFKYGRFDQLAELAGKGWNKTAQFLHSQYLLDRDPLGEDHAVSGAEDLDRVQQQNLPPPPPPEGDDVEAEIQQLRSLAVVGNYRAADELAELLANHGLTDSLRALIATTGNYKAWAYLTQLLAGNERRDFIRFGLNPDGSICTSKGIAGHRHSRLEMTDSPPHQT